MKYREKFAECDPQRLFRVASRPLRLAALKLGRMLLSPVCQ